MFHSQHILPRTQLEKASTLTACTFFIHTTLYVMYSKLHFDGNTNTVKAHENPVTCKPAKTKNKVSRSTVISIGLVVIIISTVYSDEECSPRCYQQKTLKWGHKKKMNRTVLYLHVKPYFMCVLYYSYKCCVCSEIKQCFFVLLIQ